jgi:hypothetical protein
MVSFIRYIKLFFKKQLSDIEIENRRKREEDELRKKNQFRKQVCHLSEIPGNPKKG